MTPEEKGILLQCGLFRGMTEEAAESLLACLHFREARYQKNDVLWNMGDPVTSCAVILSGSLRAETVTSAGERRLMAFHGPGALVGDVLMATPGSRSPVYVTAAGDVTLVYLPFSGIMGGCSRCCPRHVQLRENLVGEIAGKFWDQRRRTACLAEHSLRQRISLRLREEILRTGSTTVSLGGTREDLAAYLGVNRSALSRELCRMRREGLLDFYKDTFRIPDPGKLP